MIELSSTSFSTTTHSRDAYFDQLKIERFSPRDSYEQVLDRQHVLMAEAKISPAVLIGEHSPTVTFGKTSSPAEVLTTFDATWKLVQTDRGGQATLHLPGQLVCYPIIDLRSQGISVRSYVECLERSTIGALAELGVRAFGREGQTGVFTDKGKIAFIGIRVRNGVSMHGLSLNITNELAPFQNIRACGITCGTFDHLLNYDSGINLEIVARLWQSHLIKNIIVS